MIKCFISSNRIVAGFLVSPVIFMATAVMVLAEPETNTVEVATKPRGEWKQYPTRTLKGLPKEVQLIRDPALNSYGGVPSRRTKVTGFFHTQKIDDRWWLVDPSGGLYISKGIVSIISKRRYTPPAAFNTNFTSKADWAEKTTTWMNEKGFNSAGAWSETNVLQATTKRPVAYTRIWNFMSSYGKKRGGTYLTPGHTGYPKSCIFVFDPDFESFCDEHAKQLAETRNDPWLLGHFSDNEMPLSVGTLVNFLSLPEKEPGHLAAWVWLRSRHGAKATVRDVTSEDQRDFLKVVVERYFRIVSKAIKKYDPNHMYLGSRFYGADLRNPNIFRAAGVYLDVIAVNYYHAWTPDPEKLAMWERESSKPILITEWGAKAMDSGLPNVGGAGWVVKTQADRGQFYENFTLGLLESKVCVGWHWFKYMDDDPANTKTDPANRDANKGLLNSRYEPYLPLLESAKRINLRTYSLINFFDKK